MVDSYTFRFGIAAGILHRAMGVPSWSGLQLPPRWQLPRISQGMHVGSGYDAPDDGHAARRGKATRRLWQLTVAGRAASRQATRSAGPDEG